MDADGERVGDAEPAADVAGDLRRRRVEVGLRQRQRRRHAAGQRERDEPLGAAHLGVGQRLDDEHEVDVRRQHLRGERRARRTAHDRAVALEHGAIAPSASIATQSPVVGASSGAQPPARGHEPRRAAVEAGHEPAGAMLCQHAAGDEAGIAELLELGIEIRSPAEAGGCDLHQRVLHVVVRSTVAGTGVRAKARRLLRQSWR